MVTAPPDVPGWQSTRWGMQNTEIIAAVGSENLKIDPREQYGSFYSEISIPEVKIGEHSFHVVFQMDGDDRLAQVLIRHDSDREPVRAFTAAKSLLSERFGSPERQGTTDEFFWRFPTTTISLSTIFLRGISLSHVVIVFIPTANIKPKRSVAAF
ncbi:hypothetical protein [Bradyrhizobium brasilense]|uniref:hypothetical protein n=1 Tax=Bradyrhizobium brasilense TaxID=1419277 RepID=UPI000B80E3BB|nr:hypothetical protein [Bradyrhizobium brasilense]